MGGNLLKKFDLPENRITLEEYDSLFCKIHDAIKRKHSNAVFDRTKHFYSKESFGDMDVVVDEESLAPECVSSIFGKYIQNSNVFTYAINNSQVDFIFQPSIYYRTTLNYYNFEPLGNLIGRVAKSVFDVKYGHKGLSTSVRMDNEHIIGDISISLNTWKILSFLGFDAAKFDKGFDTLEEIFEYVIKSKYFHPKFFDLSVLNHINRTRNRKRKNYSLFLDYILENCDRNAPMPEQPYSIDEFFPEIKFTERKNKLIQDALKYQKAKNAVRNIAKKLFIGIEIAIKISKFKNRFKDDSEFAEIVSEMSDSEIEKLLKEE